MKLQPTQDDINNGFTLLRMGDKRMAKMKESIATREFASLPHPIGRGKEAIRAVLPVAVENKDGQMKKLFIKPVSGLAYIGCNMRKSSIRTIVCELPQGQWQFGQEQPVKSSFTTSGPGAGVDMEDAGLDFVKLLSDDCGPAKQMQQFVAAQLIKK